MKKPTSLLGLAARAGLLLAAFTSAHAALIPIDLTNFGGQSITGPNAGVAAGSRRFFSDTLSPSAGLLRLDISNNNNSFSGVINHENQISGVPWVAVPSSPQPARPRIFQAGEVIGSSSSNTQWSDFPDEHAFAWNGNVSPDIGVGSYLGLRQTIQGGAAVLYGYLEVTWDSTNRTFQLLSAAFEDTPGQAIIAGSASASVPEPGGAAMMGVGVLAVALGAGRHFRKTALSRAKEVHARLVASRQAFPAGLAAARP